MGYIDSYKQLEKLCGEVLSDERRLSAYIDEMKKTPHGSFYVSGWDDDLKQLKHYRWVRNQIAHEPGCSEENMCELGDALWLDNFYSRIMKQTDPLALYAAATKPRTAPPSTQARKTDIQDQTYAHPMQYPYPRQTVNHKKSSRKSVGCAVFLIGILIIVVTMILIYKII